MFVVDSIGQITAVILLIQNFKRSEVLTII